MFYSAICDRHCSTYDSTMVWGYTPDDGWVYGAHGAERAILAHTEEGIEWADKAKCGEPGHRGPGVNVTTNDMTEVMVQEWMAFTLDMMERLGTKLSSHILLVILSLMRLFSHWTGLCVSGS